MYWEDIAAFAIAISRSDFGPSTTHAGAPLATSGEPALQHWQPGPMPPISMASGLPQFAGVHTGGGSPGGTHTWSLVRMVFVLPPPSVTTICC